MICTKNSNTAVGFTVLGFDGMLDSEAKVRAKAGNVCDSLSVCIERWCRRIHATCLVVHPCTSERMAEF